jgi:hypothetical protein
MRRGRPSVLDVSSYTSCILVESRVNMGEIAEGPRPDLLHMCTTPWAVARLRLGLTKLFCHSTKALWHGPLCRRDFIRDCTSLGR